jgi:hypothetical protein
LLDGVYPSGSAGAGHYRHGLVRLPGGKQARFFTLSTKANIESARLSNEALLLQNLYANLFVAWTTAVGQDNVELADFYTSAFRMRCKRPPRPGSAWNR